MERLDMMGAEGFGSIGGCNGIPVFFLLTSTLSLGCRIGKSTSIWIGGMLVIGQDLLQNGKMTPGRSTFPFNADWQAPRFMIRQVLFLAVGIGLKTSLIGLCCPVTIRRGGFNLFFSEWECAACIERMGKQSGSAGAAFAMGEYCRVLFSLLLMAVSFLSHSIVEGASSGGCMCRTLPEGGSTPGRMTASFGTFELAPRFVKEWASTLTSNPKLDLTTLCYSWYGLPLYAYLIRWTGTFIFPYSNLATPLFPNGTPLFHLRYKHLCFYFWLTFIPIYMTPSLYLHTTRLYPLIRTPFVLCSINTRLYLPVEP